VIVATTYDLGGWAPESRAVLATLARRRGIAVDCDGDHLVVPARDRHQLDDLIAYLNGAAAPGVTATGPGPGAIGWGAETTGPPPAWHPDPEDAARWRWWDGHRWTSFTEPSPPALHPWVPARRHVGAPGGEAADGALRGGGGIALVGFVAAELLSVGLVLLALELGASERSVLTLAISGIAFWMGLSAACVLAVRRYGTGSLRDLGLVGLRRRDLATGVVASVVARVLGAAAVAALILVLPDESYGDSTSLLDQRDPSVVAMVVVSLFVVLGAPFFEELFFRGLVQGVLMRRVDARTAVLAQATAFGLVHYQIGMALGNFVITFTAVGLAGVVLGALRWHTGRLGPGMVAHAAFNLVAVVLTFLVL
jgi:membrane protease YdiL (CAAX protease family)